MPNQRGLDRFVFPACAASVGFLALLVQVLITRELLASFFGDELIIGLVLAAWLLLVALGAWLASGLRLGEKSWHLATAFVLLAPAIPWAVYIARAARSMGDWPGEVVGPGAALIWSAAALLAPCVLLGAAFSMCVRYGETTLALGERSPSRVYMIESLGALVGGLAFHFYLADHVQGIYLAHYLAIVATVAALIFVPRRRLLLLIPVVIVLVFPAGAFEEESIAARWRGFELLASLNTRYGNVAITAAGLQRAVFYDGLLDFTTQDTIADEELAHLGLLSAGLERLHRQGKPARVLVVGGGWGGLLREISKHPIDAVDYVEIDAQALGLIQQIICTDETRLLGSRLHIINADLRSLDLGRQRYAAIIYNLPPPSNALLSRLYAEEFFSRDLRPALDDEGAFILRLPGPQTTLGPERAMLHASVYRALDGAGLSPTVAIGDAGVYLISSREAITAPTLSARLASRHIATSFVTPEHLAYMLLPFRQGMYLRSIREAKAPPTTDQRPACYRYYLALSARQFSDRLADVLDAGPSVLGFFGALLVAGIVVLFLLGLTRRISATTAATVAVAACGFAAMALTFTVMLEFQIRAGILFHQLGLLTALFMGGLAAGSWLAGQGPHPRLLPLGFAVLALGAAFPWILSAHSSVFSLAAVSALCGLATFCGGLGGGIVYVVAVAMAGGEASPAAARLYAVDLAASAGAALIVAVVIVPVAGIPWACATVLLACCLGATACARS